MSKAVRLAIAIAGMPVVLAACATTSTVTQAPVAEGTTRAFAADYASVKLAAFQAVERLNVKMKGADETEDRYQIQFEKKVSVFSWGEVGVVNVLPEDDGKTLVVVNTTKRAKAQLTGTSEDEFAEKIFAYVAEGLTTVN
ncbi:MAG: hypothetical protein AAGD40_10170 [Pseudomonadota bacterium]